MKIVHEDESRLVLRHFPAFSILCCVLFLAVLAWVAAVHAAQLANWKGVAVTLGILLTATVLVMIAERAEASFDSLTGRFRLRRTGLLGRRTLDLPLAHISGVGIQVWREIAATDHTRRIVLHTARRRVPLTAYLYNDGGECEAAAERIRRFLQRHPLRG